MTLDAEATAALEKLQGMGLSDEEIGEAMWLELWRRQAWEQIIEIAQGAINVRDTHD